MESSIESKNSPPLKSLGLYKPKTEYVSLDHSHLYEALKESQKYTESRIATEIALLKNLLRK